MKQAEYDAYPSTKTPLIFAPRERQYDCAGPCGRKGLSTRSPMQKYCAECRARLREIRKENGK